MVINNLRFSFYIISTFLLINFINTTGFGRCPKYDYMENFNLTKFTGRWYEIERSFYLMQIISSCVTIDLYKTTKGLEIAVKTKSRWSGSLTVSQGNALQTRKHPSLLHYRVNSTLPRIINRYLPGAGLYQILDTNYDDYAILWSCTNYAIFHTDLIWIWGRNREITANQRVEIYQFLSRKNLDSERLILPRNGNCTD